MKTRVCSKCERRKMVSSFWRNLTKKGSGGYQSWCKKCLMARQSDFRRRNLRAVRERDRALARKYTYGITREQYDALIVQQNGLCALCNNPPGKRALAVDHDHKTKEIRGLLCDRCNVGLGMFHDDPQLLVAAIRYLEKGNGTMYAVPGVVNTSTLVN